MVRSRPRDVCVHSRGKFFVRAPKNECLCLEKPRGQSRVSLQRACPRPLFHVKRDATEAFSLSWGTCRLRFCLRVCGTGGTSASTLLQHAHVGQGVEPPPVTG